MSLISLIKFIVVYEYNQVQSLRRSPVSDLRGVQKLEWTKALWQLSDVTITSHMSQFWTFCARAPSVFENEWTCSAWECSALRDIHIVLHTNKMYSKRHDYLVSFNLNLYFLTLAFQNLYFNTLDREKVQGKSLGCIKSRGDTSPAYCTPTLQGATAEGWKSRGLPTLGNRS